MNFFCKGIESLIPELRPHMRSVPCQRLGEFTEQMIYEFIVQRSGAEQRFGYAQRMTLSARAFASVHSSVVVDALAFCFVHLLYLGLLKETL